MNLHIGKNGTRPMNLEYAGAFILVAASLFSGYLVGEITAESKMRGELVAERIQHARTAQELQHVKNDPRVALLCDHIRKQTTSVPEICQ